MGMKFKYASSVALVVCILPVSGLANAQSYTYFGEFGPQHWGQLDRNWKACAGAQPQSPVNFIRAPEQHKLSIDYGATTGIISYDGSNTKIETQGDNTLVLDGVPYKLVQFHFHTPSEHKVSGRGYDMELHLVHMSAEGAIAVIAVFLERGSDSGALAPIFANLPDDLYAHHKLEETFNPAAFLPDSQTHYLYTGSLTTPPCGGPVQFLVMTEPMTVSNADMARFAQRVPFNARPIQRSLK